MRIGDLSRLHDCRRIVHQNKRWFVLLQFRFEPIQLFLAERTGVGIEIMGSDIPRLAKLVIQVNEFPSFVFHRVIGLQIKFSGE